MAKGMEKRAFRILCGNQTLIAATAPKLRSYLPPKRPPDQASARVEIELEVYRPMKITQIEEFGGLKAKKLIRIGGYLRVSAFKVTHEWG